MHNVNNVLNFLSQNGKTNLMAAVESENAELVQMYLDDMEVDVNIQEKVIHTTI